LRDNDGAHSLVAFSMAPTSSRSCKRPESTTNVAAERPGQTENAVKLCLTVRQVLRLLCLGGQRILCTVRSIQIHGEGT
jgi:hypothetical protein